MSSSVDDIVKSQAHDPSSSTNMIQPTGSNQSIRILVLSDTHRTAPFPSTSDYAYRTPLPEADLLIHAGDLTEQGCYDEYLITYNTIISHPAPIKLVIPGNHDLTLDEDYFVNREKPSCGIDGIKQKEARRKHWQQVVDLWTGSEAKKHGIVMCIDEGVREINVKSNILRIYATPYTPEFCNFAFAYPRQENGLDRYNDAGNGSTCVIPTDVDIVVSHGPPHGILDEVLYPQTRSVGCKSLMAAVRRVKPLLHIFGHIHEGYGVQEVVWNQSGEIDETSIFRAGNDDLDPAPEQRLGKRRKVNYINATDSSSSLAEEDDIDCIINRPALTQGKDTLFINAAIMSQWSLPRNSPWVVDLDLPAKRSRSSL